MSPAQVTLYVAASVDGFLADESGGVEWLDRFRADDGNDVEGYEGFFATVDCLVMGANTYEQVLGFGAWPYEDRPTFVFTHRELPRATDAVEFVEGDVASLASGFERFDHVWLVGGANLAGAFLDEGLVDELRLTLVPVLLGDGIALFGEAGERRGLRLRGTTARATGLVELRYEVLP